MDRPNTRSLHGHWVPRAGGLAVLLALGVMAGQALIDAPRLVAALSVRALVSYVDDLRGLPPLLRLIVHLVVACWFALAWLDLPWLWVVALVLAGWVNFANFMDGANALVGGVLAVASGALALAASRAGAPDLAQISVVTAGGLIGFLWFNAPSGKLFLGDAGAVSLAFVVGGIGLIGWHRGLWNPGFPVLLVLPLLVDAALTLLRRSLRREHIWLPHRQHAYQRLVQCGWSHGRVAATYGAATFVSGGLGLLTQNADLPTAAVVLGVVSIIASAGYSFVLHKTRRLDGSAL